MSRHAPLWSEEQRAWLRALGHDVLAMGEGHPAADRPAGGIGDIPGRSATGTPPREGVGSRPQPASSALLRALARAAGRAPEDAELLAVLPELETLRRSPAARRALWPRLRALRKRGRQ